MIPSPDYYIVNKVFFVKHSVWLDIVRSTGFAIVKGLHALSGLCGSLFSYAFKLLDFTSWGRSDEVESLTGLYGRGFLLWGGILAVSVALIGISVILGNKKLKGTTVLRSIVILFAVAAGGMSAVEMANRGIEELMAVFDTDVESASSDIVLDNMSSLLGIEDTIGLSHLWGNTGVPTLLDELGTASGDSDIKKEYIGSIDINETQSYKTGYLSESSAQYVRYYPKRAGRGGSSAENVTVSSVNGRTYEMKELSTGLMDNDNDTEDVLSNLYYQYCLPMSSWVLIVLELGAQCLVCMVLVYRAVKLIMGIAGARILTVFFAPDLINGTRVRQMIKGIIESYFTLFCIILTYKLFALMQLFITQKIRIDNGIDTGIQGIIRAILVFFAALVAADLPCTFQNILGVDAGFGSCFEVFAGNGSGSGAFSTEAVSAVEKENNRIKEKESIRNEKTAEKHIRRETLKFSSDLWNDRETQRSTMVKEKTAVTEQKPRGEKFLNVDDVPLKAVGNDIKAGTAMFGKASSPIIKNPVHKFNKEQQGD